METITLNFLTLNSTLKCGEQGCLSSFCTYNGFRKHLHNIHSHHDKRVGIQQEVVKQTDSQGDLLGDQPSTSAPISQIPTVLTRDPLVGMCGSIVAHLQASGLSESAVQTVISSVEEVVSDVQNQAREVVLKTFSPDKESDIYKRVKHSLNQLENPFSKFNTEKKRQKYYDEKWEIVEPKEFVLGVRLDTRRQRTTGVYSQIPVRDKYMYSP